MAPVTMIRIFLVDDHEMIRRAVADMISNEPDMTVVGEAESAGNALGTLKHANADVAVLDISLGDGSGLDVCRQITVQHPNIACLMLTSVIDDRALIEAADAGAAGFCIKNVRSNELIESIRKIANGAQLLDPVEIRLAKQRLADQGEALIDTLTPQERKIFDLIGQGCTNRQIADQMFLAEKTVKNYLSNMFPKLGINRRTQAAAMAARLAERESNWRT